MSFILDALRKSEHERQRQAGPGIAELPVARTPSRLPMALLILGVLLAINVVIVIVLLLRQGAPAANEAAEPLAAAIQPAPTPTPVEAAPPAAAPAPVLASVAPPPEPVREIRPLFEEADSAAATAESHAPPPAPDPSLLPALPAAQMPLPPPRAAPTSGAGEFVPRIDTLPPQATAGLPVLNLDLHIYADDPAQRAAFINGRRYREGDSLPDGVVVESITTDGAVLRHRGQRFLLPRQ